MQLTREQRIFVVTNYIRNRSFKEVHQLAREQNEYKIKIVFKKKVIEDPSISARKNLDISKSKFN